MTMPDSPEGVAMWRRICQLATDQPGVQPDMDGERFARILSGEKRPTTTDLALIAVAFGVTDRWLLTGGEHGVFENRQTAEQPVPASRPRLFRLMRDVDQTGVSGPGHVADGVVWADGTVTLRWFGAHASTVCWAGIDDAVAVHGHGGATRFVYDDTLPAGAEPFNGLAAMLRTRRESLGLSMRAAAEQIGVSFSTVSRIEDGRRPELAPLMKVLDWLGMRIGWVPKGGDDDA